MPSCVILLFALTLLSFGGYLIYKDFQWQRKSNEELRSIDEAAQQAAQHSEDSEE